MSKKKQPTSVAIPYRVSWTGSILNSEIDTNSCSVKVKVSSIPSGDTSSPSTYIEINQVVVILSSSIKFNASSSALFWSSARTYPTPLIGNSSEALPLITTSSASIIILCSYASKQESDISSNSLQSNAESPSSPNVGE